MKRFYREPRLPPRVARVEHLTTVRTHSPRAHHGAAALGTLGGGDVRIVISPALILTEQHPRQSTDNRRCNQGCNPAKLHGTRATREPGAGIHEEDHRDDRRNGNDCHQCGQNYAPGPCPLHTLPSRRLQTMCTCLQSTCQEHTIGHRRLQPVPGHPHLERLCRQTEQLCCLGDTAARPIKSLTNEVEFHLLQIDASFRKQEATLPRRAR